MRARVLLVLVAVVIAVVAALLAWPGGGSHPAGPAGTPDRTPSGELPAPTSRVQDGVAASPADTAVEDPEGATTRTEIPPGRGRLLVRPVIGSVPVSGDPTGVAARWIAFDAVPLRAGGDASTRSVELAWIDERWLGAELAGGTWRIRCRRGPGDPGTGTGPAGWFVDPDDVLSVVDGGTTRADVRIVRSATDPVAGQATIVGVARVDNRPAAGHVVRLSPLADGTVGRVLDDGTFRLERAPTGWRDLELWSPASRGGSPLCLARRSIAPRDGETVRIELDGETASIEGLVLDAAGRPTGNVQVRITTEMWALVGPSMNQAVRSARTGPDGRFEFPLLPAGSYRLQAEGPSGVARPTDVDTGPGRSVRVRLALEPYVSVRGALVLEENATGRRWRRQALSLVLVGPVERVARCRPGPFEVHRLLPGTYRVVEWQSRGHWRAVEDLVVPPGGLDDARIVLRPVR